MDLIDQFIADLRADGMPLADDLANDLAELHLGAETNPDLAQFYAGVLWILKQPRTADEKLKVLERMVLLPIGKNEISMRQFTGWH
jgi:hypothetical protein